MRFNAEINNNNVSVKMPVYHGHTKITLTDVNTGKVEIYEEDNIVTNAVANILKNPYFSLLDLNNNNVMPVKNMFAGVLCFHDPIAEDKNNYSIPADNINALIAHAGDEAHATNSNLRGNPNGAESGETTQKVGYKFVWDWATNQGNGTIAAVCLTHRIAGNIGTKPIIDYNTQPITNVTIPALSWLDAAIDKVFDREQAIQNPLIYNPETREGVAFYQINGAQMEVIKVRGGTVAFGVNDIPRKFVEVSAQTLAVSVGTGYYSCFVHNDKVYFYSHGGVADGATRVNYWEVNPSNYSVNSGVWIFPTLDIKRNFDRVNNTLYWGVHPYFPFNNGYLYLPNVGNNTFIKCNIENNADVSVLNSNITALDDRMYVGFAPINISNDFIVGSKFIINGAYLYSVPKWYNINASTTMPQSSIAAMIFNNLCLCCGEKKPSYLKASSGVVMNPYYLATINNLSNPVTKQNSQTMKIEYSITEEVN